MQRNSTYKIYPEVSQNGSVQSQQKKAVPSAKDVHWSTNIIAIVSVVLLICYAISYMVTGSSVQLFTIPWSYRISYLDLDLPRKANFSDPQLWSTVLHLARCDEPVLHMGPVLQWEPLERYGLCTCLNDKFHLMMDPVESEDELSGMILTCMLSGKGSTVKGLFQRDHSFWASNTASLVGLWNILAVIYVISASLCSKLWRGLFTTLLVPAFVLICFRLPLLIHLSYWAIILPFSWVAIMSDHGQTNLKTCITWLYITLTIPIATIIYNVTTQRKEILFMFSSIIIVLSMVGGTIAADLVNQARVADNISNYICLCNMLSTILIFFVSYDYMVPNLSGNMGETSGLVLFLLLASLQLFNTFTRGFGTKRTTDVQIPYPTLAIIETIARSIATICMMLDFRAVCLSINPVVEL
jgi:hypothetical protein